MTESNQPKTEEQPVSVARLLRFDRPLGPDEAEGHWRPVGDPLPPFAHAPPVVGVEIAPWVLPCDLGPRSRDVILIGETAHQLLTPCPPDDMVYQELAEQTALFHGAEEAIRWIASIEVWIGRRLSPTERWPEP